MKILCLGGAGRICRESVCDLVQTSSFERISIADANDQVASAVVGWCDDPRVDFVHLDVRDQTRTVALMREYDLVMDGLPISMNDASTACMAEAGVDGINLNGLSREWSFDQAFKDKGKTCVPGFGMTPGATNLMAMHAANQLDTVSEVFISHGAFRPIAFSASIAETTCVEYDPGLKGRVVFEDGRFIQVPPFARPKEITLPEPFGTHTQYIIPHPETMTLAKTLADKGVRLIEVRGTWPPKNMELLRALHDWGFLHNDKVHLGGHEFGIMDAIAAFLTHSAEGQRTELYGYALHVEVAGTKDGKERRHVLHNTHPASDGSVEDWAGLRAYTRSVGIPMSIGAQLIAAGSAKATGAVAPEAAFDPQDLFDELAKRKIVIHEEIIDL